MALKEGDIVIVTKEHQGLPIGKTIRIDEIDPGALRFTHWGICLTKTKELNTRVHFDKEFVKKIA